MASLKTTALSFEYGDNVILDNVDLEVREGQVVCVLGESGSGKTSLFKILAGIEEPSSGDIFLNNKKITNFSLGKRDIGLVFQEHSLFPHLTIAENILFGVKSKSKAKLNYMLKKFDLVGLEKKYPHMLSGGQKQRVSIARSLILKPKVMLFDEAFASIDVLLKDQIRADIIDFLKENKITSLFITHDPEEALKIADIIYIIKEGRIIAADNSFELYNNPSNKFVASLFGEINLLQAKVQKNIAITEIGKFPLEKKINNEKVEICVRPENIKINKTKVKNSYKAKIEKTTCLGTEVLLNLNICEKNISLRAKIPSNKLLLDKEYVYISIEKYMIF